MAQHRSGRLVLGIGNADRGDDAAGCVVARRLRGQLPADVAIGEHDGELTGLLARLAGVREAILVDACSAGSAPGTVRRFDVQAAPLPALQLRTSTHAIGLGDVLELARAMGELPPRCIVYAIEGAAFATGAPLSAPVAAAVDDVAGRIRTELTGPSPAHDRHA